MKFRMYFGGIKTAIISIVIAGALAVSALDICLLVGVNGLKTASPAVGGVSLAASVIIGVAAALILFNSFYSFKDEELTMVLGFFRDRLPYEKINAVKQNVETKEIYVSYDGETETDSSQTIRLNVSAKKSEAFLTRMRKACPFIIVEPFTPEKKDKKKK